MGGIFDSVWEHGYREGREDAGDEHDFYSLLEARSEIARHHRDFAAIRKILDGSLLINIAPELREDLRVHGHCEALKKIRQIVG